MYALVIVEYPVKTLDKTFTYKVPTTMYSLIKVGMKVEVPFGNSLIHGFVLNIFQKVPEVSYELREINRIVDDELILSPELLEIADYLKEETLCTKISAIQTMLPPGLKAGKKKEKNYTHYETYIKLNPSCRNILITSKGQQEIIDRLKVEKVVHQKEINNSSLKTLLRKNIVIAVKVQTYRLNNQIEIKKEKVLTKEQEEAFTKIKNGFNTSQTFLLFGITGSGKTEIYIKLIKEVIKQNKTALMMVPEISLTTQIASRFYEAFGNDVAILHSSLSKGEKYDEYLKILRKEVSVVVGTRSSVFAPLENLGIIIIDEEDSSSYKQDSYPKYNAKNIAEFRSKYHNIPLVLASATPSLESKARADKEVYKLITLNKRIGSSTLPEIHIVDMEKEMKKRNMILSELLQKKIKEKLTRHEQIILLLNRRGYSTFITCSNCGFVYKCPNCDISLTYHKTSNNLQCHYCGYLIKKSETCPKCEQTSLNYYGLGTEKLEQVLKELYPDSRVIRMDQDVTGKKGMHEKIINSFKNEEYDILVGTQMVSKGLDFPKVSLVGVINADTSLNIPDFRSNENTFSLLSQVAGRAGRSDIKGEVIIQTFNPDNFIIKCVEEASYEKFYLYEMAFRRKLKYPPYYYLIGIKVVGKTYDTALAEAAKVKKYIESHVSEETITLGPTTANILKYNDEYRFQIIIKYRFDDSLKETLKTIEENYATNKSCYIDIDINPTRI